MVFKTTLQEIRLIGRFLQKLFRVFDAVSYKFSTSSKNLTRVFYTHFIIRFYLVSHLYRQTQRQSIIGKLIDFKLINSVNWLALSAFFLLIKSLSHLADNRFLFIADLAHLLCDLDENWFFKTVFTALWRIN